jgi:tetratricopeptide (TPR) repeat protein
MDLAIADFSGAIALVGDEDGPYCNRSLLYGRMGMCQEAEQDAAHCSTLHTDAVIRYSICKGDYATALDLLDGELVDASAADQYMYYHQQAEVYLKMGRYEDALNSLDLSLTTSGEGNKPGFWLFEKAEAEYYLGHYEQVKKYIQEGEQLTWMRWGRAYYFLGMITWQEGDSARALTYLEWAEKTLDEGDLLEETRAAIQKLKSGARP